MYISTFYVFIHSFIKMDIFVVVQKGKICHKKSFFSTKFFILHSPHKNNFFLQATSWARRTWRIGDVPTTFLFEIFKYVENAF
jgi:hypothetical protein